MAGRPELDGAGSFSRSESEFWVCPEASYVHVQTTEVAATAKLQVPIPSTQACTSLASGSRTSEDLLVVNRTSEDLLVDLEPELVRGAPVSNILRRFGKEWNQSAGVWRPELSKQTQRYRYFFSHDWKTSGWMKYLTLQIYFNGTAAAVTTCILSLGLGVLGGWRADRPDGWLLPRTAWWVVTGHVGGMLVLFFWQHLRELLLQPRLGFLDRVCIPQDDHEKKYQCVYGLASILDKSEDLIVLWSPRYFGRLWCMYEIACFLMKRKEAHKIKFLPVQISVIWILTYFAVSTTWLTLLLVQRFGSEFFSWHDDQGLMNVALTVALQVCVLYPPLFYFMNQMMYDIAQLPGQLRDFNIHTAQCFCCSNGHEHPVTREPLQCDRELIYGVLQMWSSRGLDATDAEHIQAVVKRHFDRHLAASVEEAFTHTGMLMRPLISAAAIGSLPFMSDFVAYEAVKMVHYGWLSAFTNLGLGLYMLFYMPLFIRFLLLAARVGSLWWTGPCCKCIVIACQALALFLLSVVVIVGYSVCNAVVPRDAWTSPMHPMPMYLLGMMVLGSVILGFRHLCPCRKSVIIGGMPCEERQWPKKSEADSAHTHAEEPRVLAEPDIVWGESFFGI